MSIEADAANQILSCVISGVKIVMDVGERTGIRLVTLAIQNRDQNIQGEVTRAALRKGGQTIEVTSIRDADLQIFKQRAEAYGVPFSIAKTEQTTQGWTEIMVRSSDAGIVNYILQQLKIQSEYVGKWTEEEAPPHTDADAPPESDNPADVIAEAQRMTNTMQERRMRVGNTEAEAPEEDAWNAPPVQIATEEEAMFLSAAGISTAVEVERARDDNYLKSVATKNLATVLSEVQERMPEASKAVVAESIENAQRESAMSTQYAATCRSILSHQPQQATQQADDRPLIAETQEETSFLQAHCIHSRQDLTKYQKLCSDGLLVSQQEQTALRDLAERLPDDSAKAILMAEADGLNNSVNSARSQLRMCVELLDRKPEPEKQEVKAAEQKDAPSEQEANLADASPEERVPDDVLVLNVRDFAKYVQPTPEQAAEAVSPIPASVFEGLFDQSAIDEEFPGLDKTRPKEAIAMEQAVNPTQTLPPEPNTNANPSAGRSNGIEQGDERESIYAKIARAKATMNAQTAQKDAAKAAEAARNAVPSTPSAPPTLPKNEPSL